MKIDQVVVTGMMAIALSASPNADGVLTPMVITVRPASESLEARDLTVLQGNTRVPVVRLQRLTGTWRKWSCSFSWMIPRDHPASVSSCLS
jgi:hypothetical protein